MKTTQGTKALFYKPTDRWQIWVSLAATLLLYLGAVALAAREPEAEPVLAAGADAIQIEYVKAHEEPPPPLPEETPEALPTPDIESDVPEENPTPAPRKHREVRQVSRLVRQSLSAVPGPASLSSAKVFAVSAPRPEYPYEARRQRLTGSGVALLVVEPGSGAVTNVTIARSTGNPILDNAAISGFRRWRFKPGTVSKVQAPITFTLTGAAY